MAIARMAKIMIISHRSQASDLLEALQSEGTCQILNADEAMVAAELAEPTTTSARPRQIRTMLNRIDKSLAFVKNYAEAPKGMAAALAPRTVIDEESYEKVAADSGILRLVDNCESVENAIERAENTIEALRTTLAGLQPWKDLKTPVQEIDRLHIAKCWAGLIPTQQFDAVVEKLTEFGAAVEVVGSADNKNACLVVTLKETAEDVQKVLRAAEFEAVNFEGMTGTAVELIAENTHKLDTTQKNLVVQQAKAEELAKHLLTLKMLCDHQANLLSREQVRGEAPTTEQTVILEGWVRKNDYTRLEKLVAKFDASSLNKIEPHEDEDVPVEIDNGNAVRPFESITRLYGMPLPTNLDPTVFLAPFFTIFFGLCLTDAGYGFVLVAILYYFIKRIQGDAKFLWMLLICSAFTIVAGALTGGWFGDAVQTFMPESVNTLREKIIVFDPMKQPMVFFAISLGLGYIQIMFGLCIALVHNLRAKDYVAALCDQITWLIMLNSLLLFGLAKGAMISPALSGLFGILSLIPALIILIFSVREGGWGGRVGMGVFNLFCTVFYLGDVLSYVRIMALGMVTGGFGLAVNISVKLVVDVPYVGWILGALIFAGGHMLNIALSTLGSFVHSMRLQFVEFFPKFFEGGGKQFVPLRKEYKHVYIEKIQA